ncbi:MULTISPECIES: ATP phosphoribosyltransferase regulatory subunit [unclassified Paenibacillus]|uniref:ATP phosphoribosyltransferase regulatory subunit n=1 Tax=unclassified Paenibacillus TaxID=185978 RepID=UPI000839748D|nr:MULTISPECIES: ATP phosphoribosyltransferase regulatory subunit [unclassified Paenibacillus]NWL86000.1 ATP phosphoribosyltransferase regulatory subunit [Paenibacillus sp. 79R4]
MSKPKGFEKPAGVRDYLPFAVEKLREIERRVLDCMAGWGYRQIMTPTMEYYDTVGVASSTSDQKLFKLLNNRGTTMVLRSDMTTPIARVVSSLLKEELLPLRLSYHANVFRSIEEEAGKEAEFYQTGVELVGDNSAEADAEVVALAVASLQAAGVSSFKIALGHVGFLNGLLEEAIPGREDVQQELKDRLLGRDFVGYREILARLDLSAGQRDELTGILKLRGGKEVCREALELSNNSLVRSSIEYLSAVWEALEDFDVARHVIIDLTMIGDFSYYTGLIFEGYAADIGFPVCGGGRYDKLLQQFGRPAPATGFSLKTNRILDGVDGLKVGRELPLLMQYDASNRRRAYIEAERLRSEGKSVRMRLVSGPDELRTGDDVITWVDF